MTQRVRISLRVRVPAGKLWAVIKDFGEVHVFAESLRSSALVGDKTWGLGAKRKCTFHNGKSLLEEIVEYKEGESFKMELSEHQLPIKSMFVEVKLTPIDTQNSELEMQAEFIVRGGLLGRVLGGLMKPVIRRALHSLLMGLAYYTATGKMIDNKLPRSEELNSILVSP